MNLQSVRCRRHLVPVVCILAVVTCTAFVYADSIKPAYEYQAIKRLHKKTLEGSGSGDLNALIDKAAAFVNEHPGYKRVARIHYILGNALSRADRPEEALQTYQRLTRDYSDGSFPGDAWLEMGLACDKLGRHDEADAAYRQLVDHPRVRLSSLCQDCKEDIGFGQSVSQRRTPVQ